MVICAAPHVAIVHSDDPANRFRTRRAALSGIHDPRG